MLSKQKTELLIVTIAILAGLAGVVFYIISGQGSFELQKRQLQNTDSAVEDIKVETQPEGGKDITVNCEDGTSYDIYLPPGETNYDAVAASKC